MGCGISKKDFFAYAKKIQQDGVKITKGDIEGNKPYRFDNYKIIPKILIDLFRLDTTKEDVHNALILVKNIVKSPAYMKKINGLAKLHGVNTPILVGATTGAGITSNGIAFNHIISDIKTQKDLAKKYHLTKDQQKSILPDGNAVPASSALGLYAAIGRDIAHTMGMHLSAKAHKGKTYEQAQKDVENMYTEFGRQAVADLAKVEVNGKPLLSVEEGMIINRRFYDGSPVTDNNGIKEYKKNKKIIPGTTINVNFDAFGVDTVSDNNQNDLLRKYLYKEATLEDHEAIMENFENLVNSVDAGKFIFRLKIPSNLQLPQFDVVSEFDRNRHDVATSNTEEATITQITNGALAHKTGLASVFNFLYSKLDEFGDLETYARTLDEDQANYLFGFKEEAETTDATRESERGQALSKTLPFTDFIENWGDIAKENFRYLFKKVRNSRLNVTDTVGNYQTDKFFSRFIMGSPTYKIAIGTDKAKALENPVMIFTINSLYDQGGLDTTTEIYKEGVNKDLDKLVNGYEEATTSKDPETIMAFMLSLEADSTFSGSPWKIMDTLDGISSVRKGLESGSLESQYMPKPDGTASGGTIMSAQMAGKFEDPTKNSIFDRLGFGGKTVEDAIRDIYQITEDVIATDMKSPLPTKGRTAVKWLKDSGIYTGFRDLAKDPSITVLYHQGKAAAIDYIATNITNTMYDAIRQGTVANKPLKELADTLGIEDVNKLLESDSQALYDAIYAYNAKDAAPYLHSIVQSKFTNKYMKANDNVVKEVFNAITTAFNQPGGGQRLTIIDAFTYYTFKRENGREPTTAEKAKMYKKGLPLMKLFEVVEDPSSDDTVVRKEIPHEIAAYVNVVHMLDSAILMEAYRRTFGSKALADAGFDFEKYGTQPVYDAVGAHPEFALEFQKNYREAFKDINMEYDINAMLVDTYSQMPNVKQAKLKKLKATTDSGVIKKRAVLKDMQTDVTTDKGSNKIFGWGDTLINDGGKQSPKPKAEPAKKPTPVKTVKTPDVLAESVGQSLEISWSFKDSETKKQIGAMSPMVELEKVTKVAPGFYDIEARNIQEREPTYEEVKDGKTEEAYGSSYGKLYKLRIRLDPDGKSATILKVNNYSIPKNEQKSSVYLGHLTGKAGETYAGRKTSTIVSLDEQNKTALSTVNSNALETVDSKGFKPKKEQHITILGFPQGKQLKKIFKDKPEMEQKVNDLLAEADFTYDETADIYTIQRDMEVWIDWKDQSKGKKKQHDEAIIMKVDAPGIKVFIDELNTLLGTEFPVPFAHISLATKGSPMGIGVANEAAFNKLKPVKLPIVATKDVVTKADFDVLIKEQETAREANLEVYDSDIEYVQEVLKDHAKNSPIIKGFIEHVIRSGKTLRKAVGVGTEFAYSPAFHKIKLPIIKSLGKEVGVVAIEHEIAHFYSEGYMAAHPNNAAVKYVTQAAENIGIYKDALMRAITDDLSRDRILYAIESNEPLTIRSELVAVLGAEPKVAADFIKEMRKINDKNLPSAVKLVKTVKRMWNNITNFTAKSIDGDRLLRDIHYIIKEGAAYNLKDRKGAEAGRQLIIKQKIAAGVTPESHATKKTNTGAFEGKKSLEEALAYHRNKVKGSNTDILGIGTAAQQVNEMVAEVLWNRFGSNAESLLEGLLKAADQKLNVPEYPMYQNARNIITDAWGSEFMQGLIPYLNPSSLLSRAEQSKFMSQALKALQTRNKIDSTEINKIDNMMKGMTKTQVSHAYKMFAQVPAHMLVGNRGLLRSIADKSITIDEAIANIESRTHKDHQKIAQQHADMLMKGQTSAEFYNINHYAFNMDTRANIEELIALYSMKQVKGSQANLRAMFRDNEELYHALSDASGALANITQNVYSQHREDTSTYRANMVNDYYEIPKEVKVITKEELSRGLWGSNEGWTVLRDPDESGYGIAYKDVGDVSYQQGTGTNISYVMNDLLLPQEFEPDIADNSSDSVKVVFNNNTRYKLILTQAEKEQMGLIQNPAQALLRSYSHVREIKETQAIRDAIVEDNLIYEVRDISGGSAGNLKSIIADKTNDNPFFLKLGRDILYKDLPKEIQHKYRVITEAKSNIDGFNTKIDLVRKDISPWLMGYQEIIPFENSPELRKIFNAIKQMVKLLKIHWIIVNPAKIAMDAVSNTTLLISLGVSPVDIMKGYRDVVPQFASMAKLRARQVELSVKEHSKSSQANKDALAEVEEQIASHPLAGVVNAGMMQSLSTDIILKDYDTITGLQRNVENVLNGLTMQEEGVPNGFGNMIHKFSEFGINIEDVMRWMSKGMDHVETSKTMGDSIREMAGNIERMKDNKEVGKYLAEYIAAPNSSLTKVGSMFTLYPDAISKTIYRTHLINATGKSESELTDAQLQAIDDKVNDAYLNYGINPPKELKLMGDYLLTPFITFWARIQRTIAMLAKHNPATFFGTIIAGNMLGLDPEHTPYHIAGSNIFFREEYLNEPLSDIFSLDTVVPVNMLNFQVIR